MLRAQYIKIRSDSDNIKRGNVDRCLRTVFEATETKLALFKVGY
jgi:hypothetical protein